MKNSDIADPLFREAVEAIDTGDLPSLQHLLGLNPQLVGRRLDFPDDGYFKHPYLLWFVADNPIRHGKLPANISEITRLLIRSVKRNAAESLREQIDYTLGLVATGRVPRESGVQIELIDLLIDEGATPGNGHGALAHGNRDAAKHLIQRGGKLTLATAVCLEMMDDVERLLKDASSAERQVALMAAAFYGKPEMIRLLVKSGADVNAYIEPSSGFHSHASALHQAVSSGSVDAVKVLIEAGANPDAKDRIYNGTPLGWAMHMQEQEKNETKKKQFAEIESFLLSKQA